MNEYLTAAGVAALDRSPLPLYSTDANDLIAAFNDEAIPYQRTPEGVTMEGQLYHLCCLMSGLGEHAERGEMLAESLARRVQPTATGFLFAGVTLHEFEAEDE